MHLYSRYTSNPNICTANTNLFGVTAFTLLSETQIEVVGNWGVGIGCDWYESLLLCPLDQSLRSCRQLLFHRL